ncbi:hypothetical protein KIN20_025802 [Parelaphostrongylus tenuis]|uniref:Uncharacterized protein n=1 Tax=Parelaphostrongylus tenuis TaxID=148309 RepID=A0AAD5NDH7_PARTN|nr:hypothetical protein KIN20_025802 [Parelaphostrongylus tenuis]
MILIVMKDERKRRSDSVVMSTVMRRTPGPSDTNTKNKKGDSLVDKLAGTLTRKKKSGGHGNAAENPEEDEALEIEIEGRESIDACLVPSLAKAITLDEG